MANLTATEELIRRLKNNREPSDKSNLLKALSMFSSPEAQKQIQSAIPQSSAFSPEEERLAKASNMEMRKLSLVSKLTVGNTGDPVADEKALEKIGLIADGAARGATNMRDSWKNIAAIDNLKRMTNDFDTKKLTFDRESNMEFSNTITGLVSNRAPGIEAIRETAYRYFGGDVKAMLQYFTGNPRSALSQKMMKELVRQVRNIEIKEKDKVSQSLTRMFNAYKGRFKRNPDHALIWKEQYGDYVDFDLENTKATSKSFEKIFEAKEAVKENSDNYPLDLYKNGRKVTVSNAQEFEEASKEGWSKK